MGPSSEAALPGVFPKALLLAYHPLALVPGAYRNLRAELLLSRPSAPPRHQEKRRLHPLFLLGLVDINMWLRRAH